MIKYHEESAQKYIELFEGNKNDNKENLEYVMTVLADKGYYQYEDLKKCLESGILLIVPKQKSPNKTGNEKYIIDNFIYDRYKDIYVCPENKILINVSKKDSKEYSYKNKAACIECPQRDQCTSSANGKVIKRSEKNDIYEKVNELTD